MENKPIETVSPDPLVTDDARQPAAAKGARTMPSVRFYTRVAHAGFRVTNVPVDGTVETTTGNRYLVREDGSLERTNKRLSKRARKKLSKT